MDISKGVFRRGRTRRITPSLISIILLMILSLINADCRVIADYCLLGLENNGSICHVFICMVKTKQRTNWGPYFLQLETGPPLNVVIPEPRESQHARSAKGVPPFLSYFKTLSIGAAPGIEPATSRFAVKSFTD